jgi:hypothetical protein
MLYQKDKRKDNTPWQHCPSWHVSCMVLHRHLNVFHNSCVWFGFLVGQQAGTTSFVKATRKTQGTTLGVGNTCTPP